MNTNMGFISWTMGILNDALNCIEWMCRARLVQAYRCHLRKLTAFAFYLHKRCIAFYSCENIFEKASIGKISMVSRFKKSNDIVRANRSCEKWISKTKINILPSLEPLH